MSDIEIVPSTEREMLEERARALARPIASDAADHADSVTFTLSRERYAIPARYVFAVFRLGSLVRLPGATRPVAGLMRWRGDILTLLDVRGLVGASTTALDDLAVVLVIGVDRPEFGVLADTLGATLAMHDEDLLPPVTRPDAEGVNLIRGVTRDGHVVLDARALVERHTTARRTLSSPTPPHP
jgi:purine-binding chemotaxis protein CheW